MSRESITTGMGVKVYRYRYRIEQNSNNNNNDNNNDNINNDSRYETLEACGLSYKGYKVMVHNRDDDTIDIVTVMIIRNRRFYTCTCDEDNNRCKHISVARRYIRERIERSKHSKNSKNKRNKHNK